ncbi:TIM-barrel domain-containing protein [Ructibacterium gallinarum]|uniref:TIM-barrel domain-containing protein n=1 Tax=Ructibacterium gallinarum TaxID=2779355 RepID=UPI00384AA7D9
MKLFLHTICFQGGGCIPSVWGLAVLYRCYAKYNEKEIATLANQLRERTIPCDILGSEPGCQSRSYSCSYWDKEKFLNYKSLISGKNNGYHINLWEHAYTS